jgi:glycosyltransferase involved in cell wall biosynthesis
MKKKNLLFVIPSLSAGGGEKSLVNLLSQINYESYNVDLFLLNHNGLFMEFLPKQVNVLPIPKEFQLFSLPLFSSIIKLIVKGNFSLVFNRILFTVQNRKIKATAISEQYTWKHLAKSLDYLNNNYDVAIGFLEKTSTYFCVDKVNADKKVGWVHIDYDKLGMDPKFDIQYFEQLTKIVTVSEECANIFSKIFPSQRDKVEVIYNIVSPNVINKMANQGNPNLYNRRKNETIILTVGRLHYQKGLEMAIEACKLLRDKGYEIRWYVIGEGEERERLTKLINDYGLEDHFYLLGLKANPYPYIKQADIYVQTSRFEGKSIALDEAMILKKPIVVTNFSTAKDQIHDGETGMIVDMSSPSICYGIENLIQDQVLCKRFINNLSKVQLGTEEEINKLYRIL